MQQIVFVSHSSKDNGSLRPLLEALVAEGFKVWVDSPIEIGFSKAEADKRFFHIHADRPWKAEIREALREATVSGVVLGVWSQNVLDAFNKLGPSEDPILCSELITARSLDSLVCCKIDDSDLTNYPHDIANELQFIDVRASVRDYASRIEELADTIRRKLNTAASRPIGHRQAEYPLRAYLSARVAELGNREYGVIGELFTPLSLLVPRWRGQALDVYTDPEKFTSLTDIVHTKMGGNRASNPSGGGSDSSHTSLVVLGEPGSGKSTLLRRLEYDFSSETVTRSDLSTARFCFFVPLNEYNSVKPRLRPLEWLRGQWAAVADRYGGLPSLDEMLQRESYLLLDALNEMTHDSDDEYERLLAEWRDFIRIVRQDFKNCRVLFSCRELHYSAGLTTNDILVPHVRIEALDPARIFRFLQQYAPAKAAWLYGKIKGTPKNNDVETDDNNVGSTLGLYNTPYYLRILIDHVGEEDAFPSDRAALFTALVRGRLLQELRKAGSGWTQASQADDAPLASDDIGHMLSIRGGTSTWSAIYGPHGLPKGRLFTQLAQIAFRMQATDGSDGDSRIGKSRSIVASSKDVVRMLGAASIVAASDLKLLAYDREKNKDMDPISWSSDPTRMRFEHHLIQEYFAGKHIANLGGLGAAGYARRAPWRQHEVSDVPSGLPDKDPLPPLSTAWDETLLFAAQMAGNRATFVNELIRLDLPLAGKAAAQAGQPLAIGQGQALQTRLIERMTNSRAHLRARIAAGNALGELGDPRFERRVGRRQLDTGADDGTAGSAYVRAPTVQIPGGTYAIGSAETTPPWKRTNKSERHDVRVSDFEIGKYLVTNAEWRCFMVAHGYSQDRWWESAPAKTWRIGSIKDGGTAYACWTEMWEIFRAWLRSEPTLAEELKRRGEISPDEADIWIKWSRAGDEADAEFVRYLAEDKLKRDVSIDTPAGFIAFFDNPSQPVVGINWYEAQAYCAWLSAQTGETWRLPTEAEWEVAARFGSPSDYRYPWGRNFDVAEWYRRLCNLMGSRSWARSNTINSRIRSTTPVGIFRSGDTGKGLSDMSGNAFEWTSSKYRDYPYDGTDGREDSMDGHTARVLRGGSWYYGKDYAQIAFRLRYHPGFRARTAGFRLLREC